MLKLPLKAKKKSPAPGLGRQVRQSAQAPVFSYYANRSVERDVSSRIRPATDAGKRTRQLTLRKVANLMPSLTAAAILAVCLVYISTLKTDPVVQVAGHTPREKGLVADFSAYEGEFRSMLDQSVFNKSKLFINTDDIAQQVSSKFPELGDVSVVLPLVARRPVFKIYPAQPAVVLSAEGGPYVVDEEGRVLAFTKDTEQSMVANLPTVIDESGLQVKRGSGVLTSRTIQFINEVTGHLSNAKIPIESLRLPPANASQLNVKLADKNYFVKFDMRGEGRQQAGTLLAVKTHLEKQGKHPGEYIDVRVPGKAFYK